MHNCIPLLPLQLKLLLPMLWENDEILLKNLFIHQELGLCIISDIKYVFRHFFKYKIKK